MTADKRNSNLNHPLSGSDAPPLRGQRETQRKRRLSRRTFLGSLGAFAVGTTSLGVGAARAETTAPFVSERQRRAFQVRKDAARLQVQRDVSLHPVNGDEARYPGGLASFAKGLPHDALGRPDPTAYAALTRALRSGTLASLERVPLAGRRNLA